MVYISDGFDCLNDISENVIGRLFILFMRAACKMSDHVNNNDYNVAKTDILVDQKRQMLYPWIIKTQIITTAKCYTNNYVSSINFNHFSIIAVLHCA